jgi:pyruvate kinase
MLDVLALTEKDKGDLCWACEVGADYVAASFICTSATVMGVIAYLDNCITDITAQRLEKGNDSDSHLLIKSLFISKIESKEGVNNFAGILAESDRIMFAHGGLGV